MIDQPKVSIVVIGKNEAKNLDSTFQAILNQNYPSNCVELIYVDTNSKDDSIKIAKKYTSRIYSLKSDWPTSGLARNKGLIEASHDIIHFIDGDIKISKDYLIYAVQKFNLEKIAAITGYFEEQNGAAIFNKIMSFRRDEIVYREGYCDSTNGGGTYLKRILFDINGYDERILKGQESELGSRLREKGYRIWFTNTIQGAHNFDINSPIDFIKYKFNFGRSNGYILKMKDDISEAIRTSKKTARKSLLVGTFGLLLLIATILTGYIVFPIYIMIKFFYIIIKGLLKKNTNPRKIVYSLTHFCFNFATYLGLVYVLLDKSIKPIKKNIWSC